MPRVVDKEVDGNVVCVCFDIDGIAVEVMASMERDGETLFLRDLHVYGPGPNVLGLAGVRWAVRELGRQHGARRVVIDGGMRVTGAAVGPAGTGPRRPRRLIFDVEDP
jgi:hypothetical protein